MAKKESKAKQRVNEFTEQLDNVFLAGLGAFSNAQKMGTETFEALVKDGEKFRKEASKKTEKLIDDVQDSVREMREDAESRAEGLLDRVRDRSKLTKLQSAFDKRVADELINPLVHMLRNAIDHGLEGPEERKAAGKAERGRLEVVSYQRGSSVVIDKPFFDLKD